MEKEEFRTEIKSQFEKAFESLKTCEKDFKNLICFMLWRISRQANKTC